ncbi:hypothetical protein Tco_0614785, partial [Tanacetum coccineum]
SNGKAEEDDVKSAGSLIDRWERAMGMDERDGSEGDREGDIGERCAAWNRGMVVTNAVYLNAGATSWDPTSAKYYSS